MFYTKLDVNGKEYLLFEGKDLSYCNLTQKEISEFLNCLPSDVSCFEHREGLNYKPDPISDILNELGHNDIILNKYKSIHYFDNSFSHKRLYEKID